MGSIRLMKPVPMFVILNMAKKVADFAGPNYTVLAGRTFTSITRAQQWVKLHVSPEDVKDIAIERVGDPPEVDEDAINAPEYDRSGGIDMDLLEEQVKNVCEHIPGEDGTSALLSWIQCAIKEHGYVIVYESGEKPDHVVL